MRVFSLLIMLLTAVSPSFAARPGTLDPSFGDGGVVLEATASSDAVVALAHQSDGKILAASHRRIVRYHADGTIDPSYGPVAFPVAAVRRPRLVVLDDDAVLVSATGLGPVAKLLSNGTLDPSFGVNGVATASPLPHPSDLVVQPDGKILLAGMTGLTVARLEADGSVDTSFGSAGVATTQPATTVTASVALEADGRIVVGGDTIDVSDSDFILTRFDEDGQLDTSFGNGGLAVAAPFVDSEEHFTRVIAHGDGVVAVGQSKEPSQLGAYWISLVRYVDGVPAINFGVLGTTTFNHADIGFTGYVFPFDVMTDAAANLIVVSPSMDGQTFATIRFEPNGSLDATFGTGGVALAWGAVHGTLVASALAVDSTGRIVVAGKGVVGDGDGFALARYVGGGNDLEPCPPTREYACTDLPVGGKSLLTIKNKLADKGDAFAWQWSAPVGSDFGDPTTTESYALCMYRGNENVWPPLRYTALVAPGGTCRGRPCWKAIGGGFQHGNGQDSSSGVASISLRQSGSQTKIGIKGKGTNLGGMNLLPFEATLSFPLTVQLQASNGECWSATFTDEPQRNDAGSFKAAARR